MHNIIVFGPPGSGKGTQSQNISQHYGLIHLSTGEILRTEIGRKSACGRKVASIIAAGNLVPDDIVLKMVMRHTLSEKANRGVVLDGFPRTLHQAEMLDRHLIKRRLAISLVLTIDIPEEEIYKRIIGRSDDSGRSDDKPAIIAQRIKVYHEFTEPVIDYYSAQDKVVKVSGMAPVATVFGRICERIEDFIPGIRPAWETH
jgi:adenylate kinase